MLWYSNHCHVILTEWLPLCEFVSSQNALLQPERLFQETPEAKNINSRHGQVARSLHRCRHSCCVQVNTCFQSIAAPPLPRVERHFDHLSQHLRHSSGISTSYTSFRGYDPWYLRYHKGCDRGNAKCYSTCRRDSTSFPSITPDAELRHHRDTSRTKKTWRSSPSDCTCFATI